MGNDNSRPQPPAGAEGLQREVSVTQNLGRYQAVTGARAGGDKRSRQIGTKANPADFEVIQQALSNLLLFRRLDKVSQKKVASEMWERPVKHGEILIQEGDVGLAATEMFIVKSGKFEVLEMRKGVNMRVNVKDRGDVFGEISLMYNCPRTATVAATTDAVVWCLERDVFRHFVQEAAASEVSEIELFMNSVPLLSPLSRDAKMKLVDAFDEQSYTAGKVVIREGDPGDKFYIVKSGEAVVTQGGKEVNRLFKSDFFGERALLSNEARGATVKAVQDLMCLVLGRETFVEILGPLERVMEEEKSETTTAQRMAKLKPRGHGTKRPTADVIIRVKDVVAAQGHTTVSAVGHLDEVLELMGGGHKLGDDLAAAEKRLTLTEKDLLGEGAFSRVSQVVEDSTGRQFALKRMTKSAALQCPEHVFCEQWISKNITNAFCIRQYGTFKDPAHLYFLFDVMPGGDLMDVLVAEAKIIKYPVPQKGSFRQGCLSPKIKMWQGMEEHLARFYVASIVLALEYLHDCNIVYRDLKPENVLIDGDGFAKLGDFGFAKQIEAGGRTYTFCGTPGYVAPENVLGKGYNHSVDWWTLGVLTYVLLTARQPFSSPKTADPMEVMRRIVDERWRVKFPPYMSPAAQDLILRLLERKPPKRLGMLQGRTTDIKKHPWFKDFDWDALSARKMEAPRKPRTSDNAKRKSDLEAAHKTAIPVAVLTAEEQRECEAVFKDF